MESAQNKKLKKLIGQVGFVDAMIERDRADPTREEIRKHHEEESWAGVL